MKKYHEELLTIKSIMSMFGITQVQIAEELGISKQQLNGYLKNRVQPSVSTWYEIQRIVYLKRNQLTELRRTNWKRKQLSIDASIKQ